MTSKDTVRIFLCLPIIACNQLDANEAELVYKAVNTTIGEITDIAIEMDQTEIEILETLSDTWEGTIEANATREEQGNRLIYPLRVYLTEVYVQEQRITMDGKLSATTSYFLDPTNRQSYETTITIGGDLTIEGDANGNADIQYTITESYDAESGRTALTAEGTINDHDVEQWYY